MTYTDCMLMLSCECSQELVELKHKAHHSHADAQFYNQH